LFVVFALANDIIVNFSFYEGICTRNMVSGT
jgi:hypothetical protein